MGGGIYKAFTSKKLVRKKYVHSKEDEFPSMRPVRQNKLSEGLKPSDEASCKDKSSTSSEVYEQSSSDSDSNNDANYGNGNGRPVQAQLKYVSTHLSTLGKFEDEFKESSAKKGREKDVSSDSEEVNGDVDKSSRLRRKPCIFFGATAILKAI